METLNLIDRCIGRLARQVFSRYLALRLSMFCEKIENRVSITSWKIIRLRDL